MSRVLVLWLLLCLVIPVRAMAQREMKEPLLIFLHGPSTEILPIKAALTEIVGRDGGVIVDVSPGEKPVFSAASKLRKAIAAYHEFDYQASIQGLNAALAEAEVSGAAGLVNSELSDLHMYRALVQNEQGDTISAWDSFVQSALVAPARHLDAVRFSPSVAANFERARKQVEEGGQASLKVNVDSGCELFVDAEKMSPNDVVQLPIGEHYLRVQCLGRQTYVSRILLQLGQREVSPTLRAIEKPTLEKLSSLARSRGFANFIWVHTGTGPVAGPIVEFELWDTDGKRLSRTNFSLKTGDANRKETAAAIQRSLSYWKPIPGIVTPALVLASGATPWYRSPWLWAAAGAVVTTSVLLPFVLRGGSSDGFDVSLGGARP